METIYQYSIFQQQQQQHQHQHASVSVFPNNNSCFIFNLHFTHHLHLSHPRHVSIPLNSLQDSFFVPSHLLFSHPHDVISTILDQTGVSSDFIDALVPQVHSFAFDDVTNEGNVVFLNLSVVAVTPFDDHEEIERAMRESVGEECEAVMPAREASVEALKRVEVEGLSECCICLEEFESGMEVIGMPCDHVYHKDCILEWLKRSHLCPLCRFSLPT